MKRLIFLLIIISSFSYSQNKNYELNDDFDNKNFLKKTTPYQPIKPVLSPPNKN